MIQVKSQLIKVHFFGEKSSGEIDAQGKENNAMKPLNAVVD